MKKGAKLKISDGLEVYYVDEFWDEEINQKILVCGSDHPHLLHIPESEVEIIDASYEERVLDVLVSISSDLKHLATEIGDIRDVFFQASEEEQAEFGEGSEDDDLELDKTKLN